MKATLKINDKEIEVDITEEELKKFEEKKPRVRWRAEKENKFWYISVGNQCGHDHQEACDDFLYSIGNYFQTQEEADFHKNELIYTQMLKDYIYEHDDVELDWKDASQPKWSIEYDTVECEIVLGVGHYCKAQGVIYASNKRVLEDAVKFIGEENVKKYILKVGE